MRPCLLCGLPGQAVVAPTARDVAPYPLCRRCLGAHGPLLPDPAELARRLRDDHEREA